MRHKLFTLLFALMATIGTMLAEDAKIGNLYYQCDSYSLLSEGGTVIVTGGVYGITSAQIPSSIKYQFSWDTIPATYTVHAIDDGAFSNCTSLTAISIPESVTYIGARAFSGCSSLTAVHLPNSVTSIEEATFSYCIGLTSIDIPNSVTIIGRNAFDHCANLASISIPYGVTSIGEYAFSFCGNMTSVTIPNSVSSIGRYAFACCSHLISIYIPGSVTAIDDSTFDECWRMTNVTIGDGLTSIGSYAFNLCTNLTSVNIPNSVTSIGNGAFRSCESLSMITIPNSVTTIGNEAFYGCRFLTSVFFSNNVTTIGDGAFFGCSSLTSVDIPNSVTYLGKYVFAHCNRLTSVTLSSRINCLEDGVFCGCYGLTSIEIPNSIISIGDLAFSNCLSLKRIYNNAISPQIINGNVFEGIDKTACLLVVPLESITSYQTADVWKEFFITWCIADYGMCGENIGWTINCDTSELWIQGSGTMTSAIPLEDYKNSLQHIYISKGVTSMASQAFSGCHNVSTITCKAVTPPVCGESVFDGINKSIPLYVPKNSLDQYRVADQWKDFFIQEDTTAEIIIEDSVITIIDDTTEIIIPTIIPNSADLAAAGYHVNDSLVVCLYFDVAPCFDVYFPGNYRMNAYGGWSTDISELERFEPLPGFPGWYVVEVPYMNNAQGKPVQLRSDDIFDWEYQSGDADAWINHGTYVASVIPAYPGEADIYYPVPGCYIYELVYWKNHKSPCTVVPKHDYTIQLYAPDACEEMKPAVVGSFNNWSDFVPMKESTDEQGKTVYTYTIYDKEGNTFKFVDPEYGWSNQLQYYDLEYGYWQNFDNYILPETDQDTTLVFDYSENGKYRFASCENNVPTIPSGINNAISEKDEPRKLLRDGQLLILRGEKVYTLQGVEVK